MARCYQHTWSMTVAELLLRIGCTIVAWLIMYTHCLWLAVLPRVGCGSDGDELWRVLLGMVPITLLFTALIGAANKVDSVRDSLRWGAAPFALLLPLAILAIWPTLISSTLGDSGICTETPKAWHPWWAPVQLITLSWVSFKAYKTFTYSKLPKPA